MRLAAVTALALEIAAVDSTISTVRAGWRPPPAQTAAVVGGIWATAILPLVAAYLGVFALRW